MISGAEGDEVAVPSAPPEPSGAQLPEGAGTERRERAGRPALRPVLTDEERSALVERMLPAYRRLLDAPTERAAQDEGHPAHTRRS